MEDFIVVFIFLICPICLILWLLYRHFILKHVETNSKCVKRLKELNSCYNFHYFASNDHKYYYVNNRKSFNSFDFDYYFKLYIMSDLETFDTNISKIKYNEGYTIYCKEFDKIFYDLSTKEEINKNLFSLKLYNKLEKKYLLKNKLNAPTSYMSTEIHVNYTSPAGRVSIYNSKIYSLSEIIEVVDSNKDNYYKIYGRKNNDILDNDEYVEENNSLNLSNKKLELENLISVYYNEINRIDILIEKETKIYLIEDLKDRRKYFIDKIISFKKEIEELC